MSSSEDSDSSHSEDPEYISHENSELKCFCGLPAKLRVSHTARNPFRLFYNCSRSYNVQCEFFFWSDEPDLTGERQIDELNLIRNECTRLQGRLEEIEQKHDIDRIVWEREKAELLSEISTVKSELDEIKKRIKYANDSDLMPPLDKLSIADDEDNNSVVIHVV